VSDVYKRYIGRYAPSRSDVVVRKLPINAKIEVESFAVKTGFPRLQVAADALHGTSSAVVAGPTIFLSSASSSEGALAAQANAALAQLEATLKTAGKSLASVSKFDAYVSASEDPGVVVKAITELVKARGAPRVPAISVVFSASLPDGILVEIAGLASSSAQTRAIQVDGSSDASDATTHVDGTVFVGGQYASKVHASISDETEELLQTLSKVIETSGNSLADVAKVNIFMDSMGDYGDINKVYAKYFASNGVEPPARAAVEVHHLPEGRRIAIECIVAGTAPAISDSEVGTHQKELRN